jgi:hypothetical protein
MELEKISKIKACKILIVFLMLILILFFCGCTEKEPDYISIKITNKLPYDILIWLNVDGYREFTHILIKTNETREPVPNEISKFKRGAPHTVSIEYRQYPTGKWSEEYIVEDVTNAVHFVINNDGSVEKYKE